MHLNGNKHKIRASAINHENDAFELYSYVLIKLHHLKLHYYYLMSSKVNLCNDWSKFPEKDSQP